MPDKELEILEYIDQMETSRITKAHFAGIETLCPGFMPILNGSEDTKAVLQKDIPLEELHGVVINLYNSHKIMNTLERYKDKKKLASYGGVDWNKFIKNKLLLFDPIPELFYLKTKKYCRQNIYMNLRKNIAELPEAPHAFFERMSHVDATNHIKLWRDTINKVKEYYALLQWLKNYETGCGSPVVTPLVPFIDGWSKSGSISLSLKANKIATEFLRGILDVPCTMYFAINQSAFRDITNSIELIEGLYQHFEDEKSIKPDGIIVKIRGLSQAEKDDKYMASDNIKKFFESIGGLGSLYKTPLFLFQAGTYGLPAIEYGFDSFSDRLNGSLDDPIDPDPEMNIRMEKEYQFSKIYHPEWKLNISHTTYQRVARTGEFPEIPFAEIPDANENAPVYFRMQSKFYRIASRCDEVRKIKEAIYEKRPRALAEEFSRGRAKNIEKLLRHPF